MSDPGADNHEGSVAYPSPGKSPLAPSSPFAEYYRPPQLGIIHLLAWTAATAVLLKFSMAMEMIRDMGGGSLPQGTRAFQQIVSFVYSTAFGAGIVGTGILVLAKIRRAPGRLQPGHWLLLIATVTWLLSLSIEGVFVLAESAGFDGHPAFIWFLAALGVRAIFCAGMCFCATLASRRGSRWTICFASLAVVNSIEGLLYLCSALLDSPWPLSLTPLRSLIVELTLLVTVLVDLRRGPRRDWLHRLGVAVIATGVAISVAWSVWSMFATPLM
jgi:hypothetical protein